MVISTKNIDAVISNIKEKINKAKVPTEGRTLYLPKYIKTDKIDRRKYKGYGRPKYNDYIFEDTIKLLRLTATMGSI